MQNYGLDEIQAALTGYAGLPCEQIAAGEHPVSQLLVQLTQGEILRLFCANESFEGSEEVSAVFYFVVRFPGDIPPAFQAELKKLLSVLNQLLPLGTLELDPDEGLFFRHMLLTETPAIDSLLALDLVQGIDALLPQVFGWLQEVLAQAGLGDSQSLVREHFRQLLQQSPLFETLEPTRPLPLTVRRMPANLLAAGGVGLSLLSGGLAAFSAGPIWGLTLGLSSLTIVLWLHWLQRQRRGQDDSYRQQLRQLRFYWQLLEIEAIKLNHQALAFDQQREAIELRLAELGAREVTFPADVLRLREQMLSLRRLQAQLDQRGELLDQQRQELDHSRFQLMRNRSSLLPDAAPLESVTETQLNAEDMLMQNLITTLEYLDYQVRSFSRAGVPILEVSPRNGAPAISIRWLRRWHLASRAPEHTWMLCFDLTLPVTVPTAAWPRIQELLALFNHFLPLGTLICDYRRNQITLRYRFIRLRGDLSALLVMEILEVMGSFGLKLQQRLLECLDPQRSLDQILSETEHDFQSLQI